MQVTPKVELLNYTRNPEQTVALSAKLCYSGADIQDLKQGVEEKDISKFIKRLMSLGHLSTIEHVSFTFGIEGVSRAFLAQVTRHRIASFSVKSQRYVSSADNFNYIVPPKIKELGKEYEEKFIAQMETIHSYYKEWQSLLGTGESSNEDARFVLPNASETKMLLTMNARELLHFFELRCCFRAQWEIREVAWKMLELVKAVAPNIFEKAGAPCAFATCKEGKMSCGRTKEIRERIESIENKSL